jgi:hypothetical protein
MKRAAIAVIVGLLLALVVLAACGPQEYTPAGTPTALPEALQLYVAIGQAEATRQAIEATQIWIYGQQTATSEARNIQGTEQAARTTQQAYALGVTATHEAFVVHQAATDRSFYVTGTAQAIGTATAYPQTAQAGTQQAHASQTAYPSTATLAAALGNAQATAAWGNAEAVDLAVKRQRSTNWVSAWAPWTAALLLAGALVFATYRLLKMRVIQKDAFGASPVLVQDGVVMDPDRNPGPAMRLLTDGTVELVPGDPETTKRAQVAQMVRSLPASRPDPSTMQFMGAESPAIPTPEWVPADQVGRPILDEIANQVIDVEGS